MSTSGVQVAWPPDALEILPVPGVVGSKLDAYNEDNLEWAAGRMTRIILAEISDLLLSGHAEFSQPFVEYIYGRKDAAQ